MNAWPLDEGLIDYVDATLRRRHRREPARGAQRHRQPELTLGGADGRRHRRSRRRCCRRRCRRPTAIEANVATGYHAIEFLLWGQDLNGTGPGAGDRPWTDYAQGDDCTNGNCDRRARLPRRPRPTCWWPTSSGWSGSGPRAARPARRCTDDPDAGRRRDADRHGQPLLRRAGRRADAARPDAATTPRRSTTASRTTPTTATTTTGSASGTSISAATSGSTARWSRGRRCPDLVAAADPALDAEICGQARRDDGGARRRSRPRPRAARPTTRCSRPATPRARRW